MGEFFVEGFALRLGEGGLDKQEIKNAVQDIKKPIGLTRLNINDLSGISVLGGVGGKVAYVTNGVNGFCQVTWKPTLIEDVLYFVCKITRLNFELVSKYMLEAATAKSGAGLGAIGKNEGGLVVVDGVGFGHMLR